MTVFIAHTDADDETANALAKVLERRGNFVEHEEAERIGRPLMGQDALVLLWSQSMMFEPGRLVLERRALDAWADQRLIVVSLDRTFLPVGMRDLPVVDATFEARRNFTWEEIATRVTEIVRRPMADDGADFAGEQMQSQSAPAPVRTTSAKRGGASGGVAALVLLILVAAGAWQFFARTSFRVGTIEIPYWSIAAVAAFAAFVALVVGLTRRDVARAKARRQARASAPAEVEVIEAPAPATSSALFVSYAHADDAQVVPVVEAVKHQGREVWMDKADIQTGDGWAGEIVRAIRGAKGVMVMCSSHAFQSDHVKREVYLADRYKKPMLPVFLEDASLPEDFEYFFAGVQSLNLHGLADRDREAAIARAVAAV